MPNRMERVVKRTKRRGQAHKTLALAFVCSPANNLGRQGNLAALVAEIDHGATTRLQTLAWTYEYPPKRRIRSSALRRNARAAKKPRQRRGCRASHPRAWPA